MSGSEASLALQAAQVAALKADAALTALVAGRIYDEPPAAPTFGYVVVGDDQVIDDSTDCVEAAEIVSTIHVWTRSIGWPENKRIAAAVERVLASGLVVDGYAVIDAEHRDTIGFREGDGKTRHGVVTFRFLLEKSV